MEFATIVSVLEYGLDAALFGFLAYGASLVMGGGRFHRDAPEDASRPQLDLSHEL